MASRVARARALWVFVAFAAFEILVLRPALGLPFVSDDVGYIQQNAYVHGVSARNLLAIVDPFGEPARNTTNYAPVHLLAHAVEWSLWGPAVLPYHLVNAVLHALTATLLAALFWRRGLSTAWGVIAAGLFLLHPANVESTAWIFQLKTVLALGLAVAALLVHPRRPLLGLALFGIALLSKASALFALPVAAVWSWVDGPESDAWRRRRSWLLGWLALALVYAPLQLMVFQRAGESSRPLHPDGWVNARTIVAIGGRYLWMALSGRGVSPFHEPPPAVSWLDPWWLLGALAGVVLAWRSVRVLVRRREEAAWWVWAVVGYLPISQVFRFLYPMADRYLYFILPGLIGAVIFLVRDDLWPRLAARLPAARRLPGGLTPAQAAALPAVLLAALFASGSHAQARVWRSPVHIALATEARYPQGATAHLLRARRAALRGDPVGAARELRGAWDAGFDRFMDVTSDSDFAAVLHHPDFYEVLRAMAAGWIATSRARSDPSYSDLYWRAYAHVLREEFEEAVESYEEALAMGGDFDDKIRSDLAVVRAHMASDAVDRAAGGGIEEDARRGVDESASPSAE